VATVLVVEDEARFRELLADEAREQGFEVTCAGSAEQAIRIMEGRPHEILVLDLQLPVMSGMELFQLVRERWPQTQVIIITGFGGLDAAKQAIRLDVVDFITKPCHLGEIEASLARARKRVRAIRLGEATGPAPQVPDLQAANGSSLADHERDLILQALQRNGGRRAEAAAELGISVRKLHYRIAEYRRQGLL
jgi:DNA-binding NtrC family response regulator